MAVCRGVLRVPRTGSHLQQRLLCGEAGRAGRRSLVWTVFIPVALESLKSLFLDRICVRQTGISVCLAEPWG